MYIKKLLTAALVTMSVTSFAQNVGVNNDASAPDASAMLDIKSNNKGVLIPRMDMSERNLITTPATGLMIYQTDNTPGFYYNSGTPGTPVWTMISNAIAPSNVTSSGVVTVGNGTGQTMGTGDVTLDVSGAAGGLLYGTGASSAFSAVGNSGDVLLSNGTLAPSWTTPSNITSGGVISVTNGGSQLLGTTGASLDVVGTNGGVLYGTGASSAFTPASTGAGQVLSTAVAGGAPSWANPMSLLTTTNIAQAPLSTVVVTNGTNQVLGTTPISVDVRGTQGGVMYGTGAGTPAAFSAVGTAGSNQYLRSNGTGAPTFVTPQVKWTVAIPNNNATLATGSSAFQSANITSSTTAVPNASLIFPSSTAAITSFYQARENCNFTGCSGTIAVNTLAVAGTYEVYLHKLSVGAATCAGTLTGTATATSTLIGSCLNINASSITGDMGRYNIDLSGSPVALVPGDVLVLFVRNVSGATRAHLSIGIANFTANAQ